MATYLTNVDSPVGPWGVAGDDESITGVLLPHQRHRASKGTLPRTLERAARQLEEYFAGERRRFEVRLASAVATDFQRDVWRALSAIPYGQVRTYRDVATSVGRPRAARAVGNANHANPWPIIVPCHRVVAASGLGGYGGGDEVKRFLLHLEGVDY